MDRDLSSPPESATDTVLELARQLQRTVRTLRLYGVDHPAIGPAVERRGVRYGALTRVVRLAFAPDQLIVDDHEITPLDPLLAAFANHLHALAIARLTVIPGGDAEEVAALAYCLARRPGAAIDSTPLPHFPMEGLEYEALTAGQTTSAAASDPPSARQREVWRALVTGQLGANESLEGEAQAFVTEMVRHPGGLTELLRAMPVGDTAAGTERARLPGKMVARLLHHLGQSNAPGARRDALATDIASRLLELEPATLADILADDEAPQELIARGLSFQTSDDLLEMMAAVVCAEGGDSTRMVHCIGAFLSPEPRATTLLPQIRRRLHAAAEAADGEHLTVWQRVEEIALERSGERYMSNAYEAQLDDFAVAHFPNLSRYQDDDRLDPAQLATLEPAALAAGHTHLLLDLLADEANPKEFATVVVALGERLTQAVAEQDFAVAALISADLKHHGSPESPRPEPLKQTIRQQLGAIGVETMVDRAIAEVHHVEAAAAETFHRFLSIFEGAITGHLLDRLRVEEDRRVRRTIMETIAGFAADVVEELTRRLDGAPWYYARNLVHLLGDSGAEEAVRPLTLALRHADLRVAKEAIVALQRIGSPRALPFVIKGLTGERAGATADHDRLRVEMARYLANHPTPSAIEALRKAVLSPRPAVAEACRRFLHDLPGGDR